MVRFRAVDNAGNASSWTEESHHIHMDSESPVVVVDAGGTTAKFTFTDNEGVIGYKVLDSNFITITGTTSTTIEWKIPAAGTYTVTVIDHGGNTATATFTIEAYTATNLITNGSYENGNDSWSLSNAEIVTTTSYDGNSSLQFNHDNGNYFIAMSTQDLSLSAPQLGHQYYGSLMFKSSETFSYGSVRDSRYEWYYNDVVNYGTMIFGKKELQVSDWTKISAIKTVTSDTYLSNTWKIRNFQVGTTEYSYSDSLILIDLTEIFGSGNEPEQDWCDEHIEYFDGTTTIYK